MTFDEIVSLPRGWASAQFSPAPLPNYIYVADYRNYRIMKRLASDLAFSLKIGSSGTGDDQFNKPRGIAVQGDYVYVADTTNMRIMKRLVSDLSLSLKIGSLGTGDDNFNTPGAIAVDGDFVYIADTNNHRIMKRSVSDLSLVLKIGSEGTGNDEFSYPRGIAVADGYVYVVDSGNYRIVKRLVSNLAYVSEIGAQGTENDQFEAPYGIAVEGDYIYVADTYNYRIMKRLASNLAFVSKIGEYGTGNDGFMLPRDIAVEGDYIYVADADNCRIVKRLSADALTYVSEIGSEGTGDDQFDEPYSIAVGSIAGGSLLPLARGGASVPFEAPVRLPRGVKVPPLKYVETRLPTFIDGTFSNLVDAYVEDGDCAYASAEAKYCRGYLFGFNIPAAAVITSLLCQYKGYSPQAGHICRTQVSWDGGTNWTSTNSWEISTYPAAWNVGFEATDPAFGHPNWTASELATLFIIMYSSPQVSSPFKDYVDVMKATVTYLI